MVTIKELSENKEKLRTKINELLEKFPKENDGVRIEGLYTDYPLMDEEKELPEERNFVVDKIEIRL